MNMRYPDVPKYSRTKINQAGKDILSSNKGSTDYQEALLVINAWRVCHAYPINTFVATLRKKVSGYKNPIVAQRLKRLPTIIDKLDRYPSMELSRMHDIAGVRAIVSSMSELNKLVDEYKNARFSHILKPPYDYIENPKDDGYRGVHLVYKYDNSYARNDKAKQYKGLLVELQIRTKLQHNWATAVETAGTFRSESLKTQRGSSDWLDFFSLVSAAFAWVEGTPTPKKHKKLSLIDIITRIKQIDQAARIVEQIKGFSYAAKILDDKARTQRFYNLITLDINAHTLTIQSFKKAQINTALRAYEEVEKLHIDSPRYESVLVSAGSLKSLKQAYPNYFVDLKEFLEKIEVMYGELR